MSLVPSCMPRFRGSFQALAALQQALLMSPKGPFDAQARHIFRWGIFVSQVAAWVYTDRKGAKRGNAGRLSAPGDVCEAHGTLRHQRRVLACVFAGIWIADAALVSVTPPAYFTCACSSWPTTRCSSPCQGGGVASLARANVDCGAPQTPLPVVALVISGAAIAWWSWAGPEADSLGPTATGALILCMKMRHPGDRGHRLVRPHRRRPDDRAFRPRHVQGLSGEAAFGGTHAAFGAVPSAWTGFLLVAVALACAALAAPDRPGRRLV